MRRGAAVAAALLSAGCTTVGPNYQAPSVEVPEHFHRTLAAGEPGGAQLANWWTNFGDPQLSRLVESAVTRNLDIATAAARIREARALEGAASAGSSPRLDARASATRQRISKNAIPVPPGAGGGLGTPGTFGLPGEEFSTFRFGFDAAWEIDLFGRNKRVAEAAAARVDAAGWSLRDAQTLVAAEVASAYLRLRTLQARSAAAEAELARQQRLQRLVEARVRGGLVNGQQLEQQRADLQTAAAAIPAIQAEAEQQVHALATLTDSPVAALSAELARPADLAAAPVVPAGIPSELLRRRPDIRRAERQLAAATADVGVAVADLYPRFSLTAGPALVSTALTSLLQWGSRSYTAGSALDWPLFDGGRRRASIDVADARREQALLAYRAAILQALQDVEDALSRIEGDRRRLGSLERSLAAAQGAEDIARTRQRGGLITLAEVLQAQERRLALRQRIVEARGALAQDTVALFKALGGGWQMAESSP